MVYIIYKKAEDGKTKLITRGLDIHQNAQVEESMDKIIRSIFDEPVTPPEVQPEEEEENHNESDNEIISAMVNILLNQVNAGTITLEDVVNIFTRAVSSGVWTQEQANEAAKQFLNVLDESEQAPNKNNITEEAYNDLLQKYNALEKEKEYWENRFETLVKRLESLTELKF